MKSSDLFARAKALMPGGVSSPVRAIKPYPFYVERAAGSHLTTVDGADLIDCCLGYGPLILGHAHPDIREAIERQLEKGWLYGTPTPLELDLAGIITGDHPAVDMVRFVSSGSEATMAAIRLARGYTGKQDIIKIEGGFHGAHDAVLVKAGSGATTLGVPDSAGVLADLVAHTRQVPYNDTEALEALLAGNDDVAAFILEPIMGNVGPVLPNVGCATGVGGMSASHDVLLIHNEMITGYRVDIGGAEVLYGVKPDLATFGKIIGGGLPIGAFGGRREIMELVAPAGPVYQAGTFSGNPASLAAGYAALRYLHEHPEVYRRLDEATRAIGEVAADAGRGTFVRMGSLFKHFFRSEPPRDYREVKECDTEACSRVWKAMLEAGVFLPPSQFETNFLSAAHTDQDIEQIADAYGSCLFA